MSEVEYTQPSPTGTPPADDPTIPSAKSRAEIKEDLAATQSASPARLGEDLVALTTTWKNQLTTLPLAVSSMGNKGKEYLKWIKVHSSHKEAAVGSIPASQRIPVPS